jgi:thiol-disulfide isomerase/thioredoxin
MKNSIYLLLIFVLASFTPPKETITLSGKITNSEDGKIKIKGESFEKEITLKADGTFSETFPIDYVGTYTIGTTKNRASLYLSKDTKLVLTADDKNFNTTLKFTGKGSVENQYIIEKSNVAVTITNEELYKLEENDFLKKINEIKGSIMTIYSKTKFSDVHFKENEAKNINYLEQLYILNYPSYHTHYAKIEGFKASESFPKFDDKIDLDNDSEYLFSNTYKQIVNAKFNEKIESQMKSEEESMAKYALPVIKTIQSQNIKNALIQNLSYEVSAGNVDAEKLYNELITLSTNAKFKEDLTLKFNKIKTLSVGKPSPKFDYENHKGGKTSLESLKGKYVYVDVWATWCGPCRREIPSLQKVEEQYHGKNIEFVSISIDALKDHEKWSKLVTEKQLGGIQLFADKDWNSQFVKEYAIDGIPRFILIDPSGNIISADAPRPSDTKLIDLFNSLKI